MDYLDFSKECCRITIRGLKGSLCAIRGCFYLNVTLGFLNGYFIYNGQSTTFTALCTGALIGNIIWLYLNLSFLKVDLKLEKERLLHLEKLQEDKNFQGVVQQLKNSKDYYDKLIQIQIDAQNRINSAYRESKPQE